MERGTDEERAAVGREWRALERERRLTTRLLVGTTLALVGVVALLVVAAVPFEACVYAHGLYAERCTTTALAVPARALLASAGGGALAGGAWLSWGSLRRLRGDGRHA